MVLPPKVWVVSAIQLDTVSDAVVKIAGCGRLQLRVAHWATSV